MEKKGGFKECSRCGLRNKPTARQCDFCGQRFEEEDKWDQQIDALESLNKYEAKPDVSDDMSRRIESTIVKKDAAERKDRLEPAPLVAAAAVAAAQPIPTVEEHTAEPIPVVDAKPEQVEVTPVEETTVPASSVEEIIEVEDTEPLTDEPVTLEVPEMVLETNTEVVAKRTRFFTWNFDPRSRRDVAFLLILQGGIVIYLANLLVSIGSLESVGQWGLTLIAAMMLTAGLGKLAINWDLEDLSEENFVVKEVVVEVCPRCHERVVTQDTKCPACGTEFEPSELRGTA